jgi:hypothetical protein
VKTEAETEAMYSEAREWKARQQLQEATSQTWCGSSQCLWGINSTTP